MGLKLKLKADERLFISGALIRNVNAGTVIELMNQVPMLREKDILLEQDAKSPSQKLYLIVQTMYLESDKRNELRRTFDVVVSDLLQAAPSMREIIKPVLKEIDEERYYTALKEMRSLIAYESKLIAYAKESQ